MRILIADERQPLRDRLAPVLRDRGYLVEPIRQYCAEEEKFLARGTLALTE